MKIWNWIARLVRFPAAAAVALASHSFTFDDANPARTPASPAT
jgi:hypothetical protein